MIQINLLPPELKKKELPFADIKLSELNLQNLPVFNIVMVVAAGVVAIQLTLFTIGMAGAMRLNVINKKYAEIMPAKKEVEAIKVKVDDINKRSAAIDELMSRRFDWAKKLNALSDSVTQGIW
ncbi:MAG: hypothetical protein NC933_05665, partial [Candidatus Omnitrophica bacterium]|nr:hypothetical protein [Candidatus Omnitrophota bacterium]